MENYMVQEYYTFTELYKVCMEIVKTTSAVGFYEKVSIINNIRNNVSKDILNSFFCIGEISQTAAKEMGSCTKKLKFSADNLIKNIFEHPEITLEEYLNISTYIKHADYIFVKNDKNLIYFKIDGKIYQFVIKTTKNKMENFITTFHKASIKQLQKDLKRYKNLQ